VIASESVKNLLPPKASEPMDELNPCTVLAIDDDEAALDILRRMLEAEGFRVDTAMSAAEALGRLRQDKYDLILCDMWMPGLSGKEFYQRVREQFPDYKNRIIFVTGDLASEATWDFIEERRLPYVLKPFSITHLRRQVKEVLGERPQPARQVKQGVEGRRHRRISIKASVRIREKRWATRDPEIAAVVNASKEGLYFLTDRQYRVGTDVMLCFPYTGISDIEQEGIVVRVEERPDNRWGVAIAMGEAAVQARDAFLAQQDRRQRPVAPPPDSVVDIPHPYGVALEETELSDLKKKMALEREEACRLAEELADLRGTYGRVSAQRDRLAFEEAELTRQLQELTEAKGQMGQVIGELHEHMTTLQTRLEETEAIRHQATHDSLTGAWNRGAVLDILMRELARAQREALPVGVVLADLDHFKSVNDTYGHLAGDEVLRETARRMLASVREYDAVGRYGGEEFLIVLPGCDAAKTVKHAERIRARICGEPVHTTEGVIAVTASMGAASNSEAIEVESLLRVADAALYRAKNAGRNRVEAATAADQAPAAMRAAPDAAGG